MAASKFSTSISVKTPRVRASSRLPSVKIPGLKKRDYSKKSKTSTNDFTVSFGQTGLTGRS